MKNLDTYITEKILINKDTKLNSFVFKPKSNEEINKKINNLTVYLPFDIIITNNDNEHITIYKITPEYNYEYDYDYWDIYDHDDNRIAGITSAGVYKLFIKNVQIKISLFKNIDNQVSITSDAKIFKSKESNIQEKLLISKNTSKQRDYSKFGEGVEKQFSECKIYKKDSYKEISDYILKADIDKYFNDDDNVFVIIERNTNNHKPLELKNISKELFEKIKNT